MNRFALLAALLAALVVSPLLAEEPAPIQQIEDNSFLIEEAYNQEDGIVQHIQNFSRDLRSGRWLYTFTQEWPVRGQRNQFSYTIPMLHAYAYSGMGDIAINYRYQVTGTGESRFAFAPRVSIYFPTGDERRGLGSGKAGYQINLPASVMINSNLSAHSNAGMTWTSTREPDSRTETLNLGQSFIWALRSNVHLMLEASWTRSRPAGGTGGSESTAQVSPGVRWAYNMPGGLQIVPGIAVPIGVGPSAGQRSVFAYLSFEHPIHRK
jgi:hypothetical protein